MKLLDILARELKVWPDENWAAIGQASTGDLHREPFIGGHLTLGVSVSKDYAEAIVSRAEWQAAVDALNAPPEGGHAICRCECGATYQWPAYGSCPECATWNGEGNPPAGITCEIKFGHWNDWEKAEILCFGEKMVFVRQITPAGKVFEGSINLDGITFRPIRKPEQIAKDLREKTINAMCELGVTAGDSTIELTCAALYDKGYRLFEITGDES